MRYLDSTSGAPASCQTQNLDTTSKMLALPKQLLMYRLLFLFSCLFLSTAAAQNITASFDPNPISPGVQGNYTLTISSAEHLTLSNPQFPQGLQVLGPPQQMHQSSYLNGKNSTIITFTWDILTSVEGTYTVPAVTATNSTGQTLQSNEVQIIVKAGAQPTPPSGMTQREDERGRPSVEPLFQITPSKTEFYVGEMVPVSASVFVPLRVSMRSVGLIEIEKQDLAIQRFPKQFEQNVVAVNDQQFQQLTFRSVMSALKTGQIKLGPAKVETLVEMPMRGGFFGMFGEPKKVMLSAPAVTVSVLPLPAEGKPPGFSGAVGEFTFQASTDVRAAAVGEPVAVDLAIDGTGNFDAISPPVLTAPAGWKLYPPRRYTVDGDDPNVKDLVNRRIGFNVMLVAQKPMNAVPPFEFSYFNPTSKQYVNLQSRALPVAITGAALPTTDGATATSATAPITKSPEADITGILTALPSVPRLAVAQVPLLQDKAVLVVNALGLLTLVTWLVQLVLRAQRERSAASPELARRQLWAALTEGKPSAGEFYRRVVHYLGQLGLAESSTGKALRERYEALNFMGQDAQNTLNPEEQQRVLDEISPLRAAPGSPLVKGLLLVLCLALPGFSHASYVDGVKALEAGKPAVAQQEAEAAVKQGELSPEVFALLGHAHYQQKQPGLAAVWYQRAWLFPGASAELRQNLRHVSEKLKFMRPEWTSPLTTWSMNRGHSKWALLASLGLWLCVGSLILLTVPFARRGWRFPSLLLTLLLGLGTATAGAVGWKARPKYEDVATLRFVVKEKTQAHSAASTTSGSIIDLPQGSIVKELDARGAWTYIEIYGEPGYSGSLTETLRGWVKTENVELVWPYSPVLFP